MQAHILEEWRIQEIARKADEALRRSDEIHETNRNVGCLERSMREASAEIDGLRHRVEELEEIIRRIQFRLEESPE